jgi:stromal membrane-associated protein
MAYFICLLKKCKAIMICWSLAGKRRLKDLMVQKDNRFCADCGSPDPKWA